MDAITLLKDDHKSVESLFKQFEKAGERFTAKVTVLIENVRHHVKEEEQDWFPQVRKAMGTKSLRQLGEELAAAKSRAPSDPLKNISATA